MRRFTPFAPFAQLSHLTRLTPLSLALVSALVHAQTSNANSDASTTTGSTLAPVFVTANPLGDSDLISPATSVGGDDLTLRAANSLGETLNGLPGVSTTTYG
ncbi:MAG: TonB-dependent receptor, partial [Paraburkholderia tropica]